MSLKDKDNFVRNYLLNPKDLSNVPAVMYRKKNEDVVVKKYLLYMNNMGRRNEFFASGCVVYPSFPWLAASPDGLVNNENAVYEI
ncbi:hypothetical protein DPMN_024758 [Dreissena polymorpha]|uniref:Uncharacterized protein n=1 Tax=Dreissena polymorpha TaxID=45954 RepID=A0A9D4LQ99_DREPO|nr:hypothetical protein DPMN_024758 [Dreissena polymorpha]